jgi:hypothetical protein
MLDRPSRRARAQREYRRRQRAGEACALVAYDAAIVDFLIRTEWLDPAHAEHGWNGLNMATCGSVPTAGQKGPRPLWRCQSEAPRTIQVCSKDRLTLPPAGS